MDNTTIRPSSPAPTDASERWTASAVVDTVVGRLAQEFPGLPVGVIIAASVRSLRELRRVPLTTLLNAPFDGVRELVEERSRRALRDGVALRAPRQHRQMLLAADDMPVLRLLPSQMSFAEIAVAVG